MLEQMRKSSQSLLIYILFGVIIAVFIVSFGPQSQGGCEGQGGASDHVAAKVAGDNVSAADFRYGFLMLGGRQYPANMAKQQRLHETVMDKLIERELLAQEAKRLGFVVTDEEVEDMIADSKIIGLGYPRTVPQVQKDGKFSYEAFKNFVQYELSLTPKSFLEEQKRELLAARVRDLMRAGVKVSVEEVKSEYLRKERQVNLEYVRISSRRFDGAGVPTDAELADYTKKNEAKLKPLFDQKKFIYQKVPKELHLRRILVKTGEKTTDKAAQRKIEQAAARIKGGEAFAKVAGELSDDDAGKARGGDIGWRRKGATTLEGADEEKLFAAKTGEVTGPLKTKEGWTLVTAEGTREGDLSYDQVKPELAEESWRQERAEGQAKAKAEEVLAKARTEGKPLKVIYPGKAAVEGATDDEKHTDKQPDELRAEETGFISRRGGRDGAVVEGIGVSDALSRAAFDLRPESPLAGPFSVAGSYVVVRLKERKEPDMAEFEKKKLDLQRDAALTKWMEVLTDWSRDRCLEAKVAKRITVNHDILKYEQATEPPPYEPCMPPLRSFGG